MPPRAGRRNRTLHAPPPVAANVYGHRTQASVSRQGLIDRRSPNVGGSGLSVLLPGVPDHLLGLGPFDALDRLLHGPEAGLHRIVAGHGLALQPAGGIVDQHIVALVAEEA